MKTKRLLLGMLLITMVLGMGEGSPAEEGEVLGHGAARYRVQLDWAKADPKTAPVINAHAMAEAERHRRRRDKQ